MSLDEFLQLLSRVLFVLIFIVVVVQTVRRPQSANINVALLFGATTISISVGWVTRVLHITSPPLLAATTASLILAVPYLLLRLVNDFAASPRWLLRAAEAGLALSAAMLFLSGAERPGWVTLLLVLYFVALIIYTSIMFVDAARRSGGVTRRRLQTVALGSICLGLAIAMSGFQIGLPALAPLWTVLSRLFTLAAGISYFLGFVPPSWLRRAWQEPELRAFLSRAARLPRLPDTQAIVREVERGAATATGAPSASVGQWEEAEGVLRFSPSHLDEPYDVLPGQMISGRAFAAQQAIFSDNAARDDPDHARVYQQEGTMAVLAAPITAGEKRLGVLVVHAPRAPIFAEDDLMLVRLLADQAAVILESRALIDEAARVQAREEATRLKDDFLSSAAHDLKTPLTTMVALTQLMEQRIAHDPTAPTDATIIHRLSGETARLRRLVLKLLDAARVEQGKLIATRELVDLVALVREACARQVSERHDFVLEAREPVAGLYDPMRITQLADNLLENAAKYSPDGGTVWIKLWREQDEAHLSVADQGIGLPAADLPHLFERFHRGSNVDDRRFAGMGLGLFICRGIVEQHGGRIEAHSPGPGQGSTFHVTLPAMNQSDPAAVTVGGSMRGTADA